MAIEYNVSSTSVNESPSVPIVVKSAHQSVSSKKQCHRSSHEMPDYDSRKHEGHHDNSVTRKQPAIDTVLPDSLPQGNSDG